MTYENCKRLLEHYDAARQSGYTQGSPPMGISHRAQENMEAAYKDMLAHMHKKYPDKMNPEPVKEVAKSGKK